MKLPEVTIIMFTFNRVHFLVETLQSLTAHKKLGMEDSVGKETLQIISAADNFNQWMFETIKPYAKGKVLEIGSGMIVVGKKTI